MQVVFFFSRTCILIAFFCTWLKIRRFFDCIFIVIYKVISNYLIFSSIKSLVKY